MAGHGHYNLCAKPLEALQRSFAELLPIRATQPQAFHVHIAERKLHQFQGIVWTGSQCRQRRDRPHCHPLWQDLQFEVRCWCPLLHHSRSCFGNAVRSPLWVQCCKTEACCLGIGWTAGQHWHIWARAIHIWDEEQVHACPSISIQRIQHGSALALHAFENTSQTFGLGGIDLQFVGPHLVRILLQTHLSTIRWMLLKALNFKHDRLRISLHLPDCLTLPCFQLQATSNAHALFRCVLGISL
mmetsp:Transcript_16313/g.28557  ORF Transcript_16313/g.28557 Transcript_16313/m.28557 type:complete len:242 (+) Transcript_16313:2376-3101(+)